MSSTIWALAIIIVALFTWICYLITGWINNAVVGIVFGVIGIFIFIIIVKNY